MPFIPIPDCAQVEFLVTCLGQRVENVTHYVESSAWAIDDMEDLAAAAVAWWNTGIRPLVHSGTSLRAVRVTDMRAANGPVLEYNTGLPLVGTGAGAALPNNVSTVITKRTPLRGRSYRGRIYTYGMMETQMDQDAINSAVTTAYIDAWEDAKNLQGGLLTWNMCVVSRRQNGVNLTEAVTTNVLNFTSDGVVDSQRRRLSGRGN